MAISAAFKLNSLFSCRRDTILVLSVLGRMNMGGSQLLAYKLLVMDLDGKYFDYLV